MSSSLWEQLEPLLGRVEKPARYIGCEEGAITPDYTNAAVSWLMAYPDTYEIGLPNQGLQILYEIVNERDDAVAERSYAPWTDLEALLRENNLPLFSVDTHRSARDFDIIAFNLSSELVYTNVLNCIDLAGVPVRCEDRDHTHPIVGAGGHATFNPEPMADFFDWVGLGDGEEIVGDVTDVVKAWKESGSTDRQEVLREMSKIEGVYVPAMYEATFEDTTLVSMLPRFDDVPEVVEKRTVADLADWPYPKNQLVPLTEVVHDRLSVEVFRGCTRGCRFCQAGMITRPVRERPAEQVRTMIQDGLRRTGYDEVALTSLSTADFSGITEVVKATIDDDSMGCGDVSVSLPSLRVDAFTVGIAAELQRGRRSGLTFAPEAGTWRMRQVINKLITEQDLYDSVEGAFSQGWRRVKLYFLTGLPTETDEDTLGIAELGRRCVEIGRKYHNSASVTVSVGGFVPKPFTPFQWFGQNTIEELNRKIYLLRDEVKKTKGLQMKWHDPKATFVEGMLTRGDRRLGPVIEHVWRNGGTFQEWSEHFDVTKWNEAMDEYGLDVEFFTYRHRDEDEVFPWDHLNAGLHKDFLWHDWRDALNEVGLEDCRWTPCYDCGACTGYGIEHVVASATPPAGGSQGTGQDLAKGHEVSVELLARPVAAG
jgi:radical SAM family uncharacterized protein